MLAHRESTIRVLRMLMHLSLGKTWLCYRRTSTPRFFLRSDLWRRADSRWALPQISSYYFFQREISELRQHNVWLSPRPWPWPWSVDLGFVSITLCGLLIITTLDLWSRYRWFIFLPGRYQVVSNWMGNCLRAGYVRITHQQGQLSLPSLEYQPVWLGWKVACAPVSSAR